MTTDEAYKVVFSLGGSPSIPTNTFPPQQSILAPSLPPGVNPANLTRWTYHARLDAYVHAYYLPTTTAGTLVIMRKEAMSLGSPTDDSLDCIILARLMTGFYSPGQHATWVAGSPSVAAQGAPMLPPAGPSQTVVAPPTNTGVRMGAYNATQHSCTENRVDVGFTHSKYVCRICDKDLPGV